MTNNSNILSVYPATKYLTFGVWVYLVPQYKPESVLMLGYAGGTAVGLIKLLYGDVPITAVDINPREDENRYDVNFIQQDAFEYVKTAPKFDCVIVDCFQDDDDPCGFIKTQEFANNLTRIANYIIINTLKEPDLSAYKHLRRIGKNKPSGVANIIHYFMVNPIKDLHPYR
jgi:spermidine synthase